MVIPLISPDVIVQHSRVKRIKGRYTDTSLWQIGSMQRVRTKELKKFLVVEMNKLTAAIAKDMAEIRRQQADADSFDGSAAAADADVVVIQAQLRTVVECVKAGKALVCFVLCVVIV